MKRRSFLGFLLAAPVGVKAIAAEAAQPVAVAMHPKPDIISGSLKSARLKSADGSFVIDFDRRTIVIQNDLVADGTITAETLDVGTLSAIDADLGTQTVAEQQ